MRKYLLLLFLMLAGLPLAAQEQQPAPAAEPAGFRQQPLARRFSFAVSGAVGARHRNVKPRVPGLDIGFAFVPRGFGGRRDVRYLAVTLRPIVTFDPK